MPLIFKKERIHICRTVICIIVKKTHIHNYEKQSQSHFKFLIPELLTRLVSNKRCFTL